MIPYLDDRYDVVMTGMRTDENKSDSDGLQIAVSSETDLTREFDTIGWFFAIWGMFFKKDIFLQNKLWFDEKLVANEDHAFAITWLMATSRILALKMRLIIIIFGKDHSPIRYGIPELKWGSLITIVDIWIRIRKSLRVVSCSAICLSAERYINNWKDWHWITGRMKCGRL